MLRRLLAVFGSPNLIPPPVAVESVRRTWRVPASRSRSSYLRPRSSPYRIPVVTASANKASSFSPRGIPANDGVIFDASAARAAVIREHTTYPGLRVSMPATLGTARLQLRLDVNFGDPVGP